MSCLSVQFSVCPIGELGEGASGFQVLGVWVPGIREVWSPGTRGSRVQAPGGSGSLEKCSSCLEFSNPTTWTGDKEQKLHFSQDNIGVWILKTFILEK